MYPKIFPGHRQKSGCPWIAYHCCIIPLWATVIGMSALLVTTHSPIQIQARKLIRARSPPSKSLIHYRYLVMLSKLQRLTSVVKRKQLNYLGPVGHPHRSGHQFVRVMSPLFCGSSHVFTVSPSRPKQGIPIPKSAIVSVLVCGKRNLLCSSSTVSKAGKRPPG